MNLYSTLVSLHVLTAILGLGPLGTLALLASSPSPALPVPRFSQVLRIVGWSLGVMLVTGVMLIALTHGAHARAVWPRVSVGLFLVLGALQGLVRRRLKRCQAEGLAGTLPAGLAPLLYAMCALVVIITYLMEAKPW